MRSLCQLLLSLTASALYAQNATISGVIKDQLTGESLIAAGILNLQTSQGSTTNNYGFYSFTQSIDSVRLRVSYVGYEPKFVKFRLSKDTILNVDLVPGTTLKEVVIDGNNENQIHESSRMGTIDVPIGQIKALPAFMGEVDVLKVLQLLPGVQAGAEGSSGLYVRGGGPDQNLILLDGAPVYNASHLFGFFSVFNADALNHVELVKGGFPARYGGRLSSVIGLLASKLAVEGPLGNDKTTFIVSGRRTYIDALASPLIKLTTNGEQRAGYYFYDLNAKINHQFNSRNRLYLSMYSGNDKAYAKSKTVNTFVNETAESVDNFDLRWGNVTAALRWNAVINKKLFSNVAVTYSKYRFETSSESSLMVAREDSVKVDFQKGQYFSGIRDYALKVDWEYLPGPKHYIRFGAQAVDHLFSPGVLNYRATEMSDTTLGSRDTRTREFLVYIEDDFLITPALKVNAGVHASALSVEGRFYKSLQPRVSARYLINPRFSVKGSYAQMTQYIHLLNNVGIGLPTDLWVPATSKVGPQRANLTSVGVSYQLKNKYEFTIEGYYKGMKNLIEYKDGASYLNIESDWQSKVEIGKGESYGIEFLAQKKVGKLTGWVGYTLSWTNRTFENINEGRTFPYRYDRRHDLKVAVIYQLKPNKTLSLSWVYGSGAAVTLPNSSYAENFLGNTNLFDPRITYYGDRNSYRMRAYHRLDLNYTITRKTRWGESSWSFGLYNAYSRRNPFFMDIQESNGKRKFVQYSLFPIIPNITYRFKF